MLDEKTDHVPSEHSDKEDKLAKQENTKEKEVVEETETISEEIKKEVSDDGIDTQSSEESTPGVAPKIEKKEDDVPVFSYVKMGLDELVGAMQNLLHNYPIHKIKDQFEQIKRDFSKKFQAYIAEKKEAFIKAGGEESAFHYTSTAKKDFNQLVKEFKQKRQQYYKDIEKEQQENLAKRLALIEELKDLIDNAEPSTMYKNFRELQERWRAIGQIPHNKYNDVWRTYHHHVERFYDLLHLNNDFRDLDFKHNLEEKTKLVERAEALANHKDVQHAFKELQILHRLWKEDIGPVAREFRDEIWNRFSEATKMIHNKRQEFQDQLEEKYVANLDLKLQVIDKIKSLNLDEGTSHKFWQDKIKEVEKLREEFFAIGRVPKSRNEEVWQKFKESTRRFNRAKNAFYKNIKKDQHENLKKKQSLVDQAESLKDSEDWDFATEVFKKIQEEWKHIGHVPRRDSDKIWKKFKDSCNHYFDRLHQLQDKTSQGLVEVFNQKKETLDDFKEKIEDEANFTIDVVNDFITHWKGLGAVPEKMRHIESKFNKVLDSAYKKLNIDKDEASLLKFQALVDGYLAQNDTRKLDNEKLFVRRKIDEIVKEIKQLETNISFISNASEDNPLVQNVYKNIENYKKDLKVWENKLQYLNKLEY